MTTTYRAQVYDNRITRKALVLTASRPFVAIKPAGFLNPVIGHYATMRAAQQAAKRFDERVAH